MKDKSIKESATGLDRLSTQMETFIKANSRMGSGVALDCAGLDLQDLFTEENGEMTNLKAMEPYLLFQTRSLRQDLMVLKLWTDNSKFYSQTESSMKATVRIVSATKLVCNTMLTGIITTESG